MATTLRTPASTRPSVFPDRDVATRLRRELEKAAAEGDILRGDWDPALDSLRIVSILIRLEDLFEFRLPPEKVIRRGGYSSVDEGVEDMTTRLHRLWHENQPVEVV